MTAGRPLAGKTRPTDSVTMRMQAPAERIYDLVSDVTRMGEWSPECVRCRWVDGATGPVVGARFKATNKRHGLRWSNKPVVVAAEPGREFAFSRTMPGSGEYVWRYCLSDNGDGTTEVTESYEAVRPENKLMSALVNALFTRGTEADHLRAGMTATLERLNAAASG